VEISVFHRLLDGNGTKPFRLVSCPTVIPLQVPACENATPVKGRMVAIARARERFKFPNMTSPFQNAAEAAVRVDLCFRGCEEQQRSGASPDAEEIHRYSVAVVARPAFVANCISFR
jgi:hypothetical protein